MITINRVHKIRLSEEQKDNLCKLATYLQSLPENYSHFNMSSFFSAKSDALEEKYARGLIQVKDCGTAACACGHGPAAGIIPEGKDLTPFDDIDWSHYARRFVPEEAFEFLFAGTWKHRDNHHWSAAARMRYVLENGGIPDYGDLYDKENYWSYRVNERVPLPVKPVMTKVLELFK